MVRIGVLISGGGSNLQALIDKVKVGEIKGDIRLIISNNKGAYGIARGRKAGIESIYIDPKEFENMEEYNRRLIEEFKKRKIDLIVLAGFLKILSKEFISTFRNRIINIHPSLIPSFCGKGHYGERVHRKVLDYGCKITGATVHFVDEGTDTGPIILQEAVRVEEGDTVESLGKKVLKVEHRLLPEAVKLFCDNRIVLRGRKTIIKQE